MLGLCWAHVKFVGPMASRVGPCSADVAICWFCNICAMKIQLGLDISRGMAKNAVTAKIQIQHFNEAN